MKNKNKLDIMKFFRIKIYLWIAILIVLSLLGAYGYGYLNSSTHNSGQNQSSSTVQYLEKVSEVVFLNVGIQKVETQKENAKIPWTKIGVPLTEKRAIIILNYETKIGIDSPIKIDEIGEKQFKIFIPKMNIIGIELSEKDPYQLYDKGGDLLSIGTKDIDTGELVVNKLDNKSQKDYLQKYTDLARESAKSYYESIFSPIDPEIELTFEFEE